MEMVRGGVAARITKELSIPTIGIGAAAEVKEGSFPGPEHTF